VPRRQLMPLAIRAVQTPSGREQLRASLTGWIPWVGKGSLAILDQGLFAASNFLLSVLLARWLEPAEYGAFALAYSIFLLLGVFHTAILTEPMLVFGPGKYRERFPEYLGILLRGHFALMLRGAALLAATALLLGWVYSPAVERAFLALAIAGPFILLLWLVRRAFYVRLNPGWAAVGGGVYLLVLLASILTLRTAGRLTPATGFLAMAAGSLITSLILAALLRPTLATDSSAIRSVAADHWRYGRWSVATAGASWLPSNIYYVLLPAWMSIEGAAALRALMNFAMPVLQSMTALSMILLPSLVRARKGHGDQAMHKTMHSFLTLYAFGSATYLALLVALGPRLFRLLYAGKYSAYAFLPLLLVGLVPFGSVLYTVMGSGLRALEQPKWIFWSYVGSSLVALTVGIPLVTLLGVSGALIGLLFSSLTTGALMLIFYRAALRPEPLKDGACSPIRPKPSQDVPDAHGATDIPGDLRVTRTATETLSRPAFLRLLFRRLDEHDVRYCVLHAYEGLPDELPSDLDLAVHPCDVAKLPFVFRALADQGYQPVQCMNYAVKGFCFDFAWFEGLSLDSVSVDITWEYRRGGLILISGEELVAGRRKRGNYWVSGAKIEFAYLLAKKTLQGTVPAHQEKRLSLLVEELGRHEAEKTAGNLFGERLKRPVVEACGRGCAGGLLGKLRKKLWWTTAARDPLNPIRCMLADALRLTRRWFEPTGLFVVVLGPDGVGKSTLIERLTHALLPPFRHHRVFHARPMLLWRREYSGPINEPHGKAPRTLVPSIAKLLALLPDYWLGYWLATRPLLARTGLVVFDRYFHDLLVDPLRYRDSAPTWLAKFLSRFVTPPELLFLILDAPEEVILSRKREVPPTELRRQRAAYVRLSDNLPNALLINNCFGLDRTVSDASRAIVEHLARRFQRRHACWLAAKGDPASGHTSQKEGSQLVNQALHSALCKFIGRAAWPWAQDPKELPDAGSPVPPAVVLEDPSRRAVQRVMDKGFAHIQRFVVLPSSKGPRWLLPLDNTHTTLEGFHIYTPYARAAQTVKATAVRFIKAGWNGWGCSRVLIASRERLPLEKLVAEVTGEREPTFAMSLGVGGNVRKLTVQVMRANGEILGYVKLPLTEAAAERVRDEAATLERLRHLAPLRPHIPKVLYASEWVDGYILFQSPGPSCPGPVEFGALHESFLRTLWSAYQVQKSGRELVEEVAARWRKRELLLDADLRELGERALGRAHRELDAVVIPCGIMHGDFVPWNTRLDGGRLFAFDWESAAWDVPLLWDALHFHVQLAHLLKRKTAKRFLLERSRDNKGSSLLYLLNSISAYLEEVGIDHPGIVYRKRMLLRELS